MIELFGLKSFQQILLLLFLLSFIFGVLFGIYLFIPDKFKYYSVIPALPAFYIISKGLYQNSTLFFTDLKSTTTKS
ncbi:hypothetical protein EKM02_11875 [Flavobacterium sp. RSP49]|uniref:hypothetical protein n=1 Tax=Flavobacterium sp. RSP49 TaxID=2497487 RepID=UPI000F825A54|nr:hypothetical protein [Flavobacterium sp. RSP49]RTY98401.1 hypothetical protein EKM02_11875 [Flavobacterium sp. RSP49]